MVFPPTMILLTTQAFPPRLGGVQTLMESLARHSVVDAGETVTVFADAAPTASVYDQQEPVYRVQRFGGLKPLRRRNKAKAVVDFVAKNPSTVIIADSWKSVEHLPKDMTVPTLVYAHGNEYPAPIAKHNVAKHKRIQNALGQASHVIAVSQDTQARIAPYRPAHLPVTTLHNPVSPADDPSETDLGDVEAMWPASGTRLLTLCRLTPWKGVDMALCALADLRSSGVEAQLVIAGDGDDRARLEDLCATLSLTDYVNFVGRIDGGQKTALLRSADIFMQVGRRIGDQVEAFGITYLEAALQGLPAISGNQGGAVEAVKHDETGWVVDGEDGAAVTEAVQRLITDKAFYARLSRSARAHAKSALWPTQIHHILALAKRATLSTVEG